MTDDQGSRAPVPCQRIDPHQPHTHPGGWCAGGDDDTGPRTALGRTLATGEPYPGHDADDDCPPVRVITGDLAAIIGLLEETHDHKIHHAQHAGGIGDAERALLTAYADGIAEALEVLDDWRQIEPRDVLAALVGLLAEAEPADSEFVIIPRAVAPAFAAELLVRALAHAAEYPFPEDAIVTPIADDESGKAPASPDQGAGADHHGESVPRSEP